MIKTKENYEEFTRKMHTKAQEILEMAKEMEIETTGVAMICYDTRDKYINVTVPADHGRYEIATLGDRKPKLRFEEK